MAGKKSMGGNMKPGMSSSTVRSKTAASGSKIGGKDAQKALSSVSKAGRAGSLVGKVAGGPLGGIVGRKVAEAGAMAGFNKIRKK